MSKFITVLLVAALGFAGCKSSTGAHDAHDHEGHDHAAEAAHEEHGEHAGHNHEAEEAHAEETGHAEEGHEEHAEDEIVFTHEQAEAAGLTVETVAPAQFRQVIRASGRIENALGGEVTAVATTSGVVSFAGTNRAPGTPVTKNQTLVTISASSLVDSDAAARARIEFEAAERDFRRAEELVEDKIVSQREFDEARRRLETARAALGSAAPTATSTAAATGVSVAAPTGGYIKEWLVGAGEYVATGQPIATIAQSDKLQLRVEVSAGRWSELRTVTEANFTTPGSETVRRTDRLIAQGRASEGAYIPVTFEFSNADGSVPTGVPAEVWLLGAPIVDALTVPKSALTEQQGLHFVYLQHGPEDYARQEVTLGADDGQRVVVSKGLKAGDRVVTRGATQVRLAAMAGVIPEGHTH
ncbi:MAG: efflux RND transporter periplasmic adaptor subunit [Alistipes sp.]|jgi:RND family efflux transporter MFP subunit|nr:efflux RND transporter periplasmic adaptor subunit [Alistipes sp.]